MTPDRSRRLARKVIGVLRKSHGRRPAGAKRPALDELLIGILAQGVSERRAVTALGAIARAFVDWNEVRVSSACEIAAAMPELPGALEKAACITASLRCIYDVNSEMTLEFLKEKSPRDAARLVDRIDGFPESAIARATLLALGHEVFPLTPRVLKVCRRLALVAEGQDQAALLHHLKKLVSKSEMFEFHWLLSRHAETVCRPEAPDCGACALRADCRTGRDAAAPARGSNAKGNKGTRK